jgi:heme ABC exporter ATP-binding subunit CcmA
VTPVAPGASGSVRDGIGAHLEAVDLVRTFGSQRAVDGISFTLAPGQLLTLLGPNGAGKSTLLRVLAGGLRATSGEVRLGGEPLDLKSPDWLRRVGVLSHQTALYGHLTARENLAFYGTLYDVDDLDGRVVRGLQSVDLASRADEPVRTFSRGMRQRLALARTLLHDPDVVLLDEPYTGLDAYAASVLRGVLATLRDGRRTVLLVTHNLTEGLALADRLAVQVRGRLTLDAPIAEIDQALFPARYRELVEAAGRDVS